MSDNLFKLESRYFIFFWILPLFWLPGFDQLYSLLDLDSQPFYWTSLLSSYWYYLIFAIIIMLLNKVRNINTENFFREPLTDISYYTGIKLTIFLYIFSIAAAYWLFYPLSFWKPEFVNYWYIQFPPMVFLNETGFPFLPNLLSFLAIVILPPIIEEYVFRGAILHRLSAKFGIKNAVLISSIIFGLMHPDPIGAIAFGIGMCILYLKFRNLWLPIFCHALNNFTAWMYEFIFTVKDNEMLFYTLEAFWSQWYLGAICTVIVILWSIIYLNSEKDDSEWKLPKI